MDIKKDIYSYRNRVLDIQRLPDLIILRGRAVGKRYPQPPGFVRFIDQRVKLEAARINKLFEGCGGVHAFAEKLAKDLKE